MKYLADADLKGKRVFYRPDYNVPIKDGDIRDLYRIEMTYPTLDYLIEQGARIIIGTHLGRPDGVRIAEFDLRPIAEVLADHYPDHEVRLAQEVTDPLVEETIEAMHPGEILVLPNLRFYEEEMANSEAFASRLAHFADVYVNDAFAVDHRAHASLVGVPKLLPSYAGLLLQKEMENLSALRESPQSPFVLVIGGAKVDDKIGILRSLGKIADKILIGGAMANTFLLAKGEEIGQSKAEPDKVGMATDLMEELGDKILLAADYVKDTDEPDFRYLDIGEQAVTEFKEVLSTAKTIFWNGSLGYIEEPRFAKATEEIARYIGDLKGVTSIIAGGDTDEMINKLQIRDHFTFVSTGGGAALDYLAGEKLPGIEVLEEEKSE